MSTAPALGMYLPGDSMLHRTGTRRKMGLLLAGGIAVSFTRDPWVLLVVIATQLALVAFARIPLRVPLRQLRTLAPLLMILLIAHAWLDSWEAGLLVDLRIVALVLAATVVTLTTRTSEMLGELEILLRPARYVGVDPARVALAISMAIRFVPRIAQKAQQVREAQRSRGVEKSLAALLVPLLIKTLQMADQTAEALEARGLD
ncbi:MAG: energy-coupling factor transporter transmembrane protein EcfT [Actinobacteria bacterium]|nr:energy-coupling factor transporter transmembrane protein EcfT [Actinomycetota bacterium]